MILQEITDLLAYIHALSFDIPSKWVKCHVLNWASSLSEFELLYN
jgi:hypothetical protein